LRADESSNRSLSIGIDEENKDDQNHMHGDILGLNYIDENEAGLSRIQKLDKLSQLRMAEANPI